MTKYLKNISGYAITLLMGTPSSEPIFITFEPNEIIDSTKYSWEDFVVQPYLNRGYLTTFTLSPTEGAPYIIVQPIDYVSQTGHSRAGYFHVEAGGTEPLQYQWWRKGGDGGDSLLAGETGTDLEVSDTGNYYVVATNTYGTVTSNSGYFLWQE